jgi:hypothetical protein
MARCLTQFRNDTSDTKDIIPERLQLVEPNGSQVVVVEFGPGAISPMVGYFIFWKDVKYLLDASNV